MILKESSLKVIVDEIMNSIRASQRFKKCSMRFTESNNFWHIYNDLADIFDGYGMAFLFVLLDEGVFEKDVFKGTAESKEVFEFSKVVARRIERL
jgi:hypothetical protein